MILKSKNLVLRPYKTKDLEELISNLNDKKVTRFMSGAVYPYTKNDGIKWLKRCHTLKRKNSRKEIIFVIEKGKKFVGSISLNKIKKHKAELGFWIGRKYWNQGIMTEAVRTVTEFAFNKLNLKKAYAYVFSKNRNSARVLEKNGFKIEGFLKKDRYKDGKLVDVYLYAKIK